MTEINFQAIVNSIWNNIYPAMAGAALIWIFQRIRNFCRNKKIEAKYTYSGEYITFYEDKVGDKVVGVRTPATLKQVGNNISGTTMFGNQCWVLEGKITDRGYLYGEYHAESEIDDGVGNFFLEPVDGNDLAGIWSGYDSKNKIVFSGRYEFVKKIQLNIEKLTPGDLCVAVEMIDSVLGKDYINIDHFSELLSDNRVTCYKAIYKQRIVGVAIACIMDYETAREYLKLDKTQMPHSLKVSKDIGILKTVAVAEDMQGKGVGTALVEKLEKMFVENDIHSIVCVAWQHDNIENISGIMKRNTYTSKLVIKDYWYNDSIEQGFSCPVCGSDGCHCSANIYVKVV